MQQEEGKVYQKKIEEERRKIGHMERINGETR